MVCRTTRFYHTHPEARAKKRAYDKKYDDSDERRERRRKLNKINRDHDKRYGKASRRGKDASHTSHGIVYKKSSVNRGSKSDTAGDRRARGGGGRKRR